MAALGFFQGEGTLYTPGGQISFATLRAQAMQEPLTAGEPVHLKASAEPAFIRQLLACLAHRAIACILPPQPLKSLPVKTDFNPFLASKRTPALTLWTSGSTGTPRGVVLSREGLEANIQAICAGMHLPPVEAHNPGAEAMLVLLPLHHAFALISQVLLTLHRGGDLHLPPQTLVGEWLPYMQQHRITHTAGVPSQWRSLLLLPQAAPSPPFLKHIQVAGAALDAPTAQALQTRFPQAELWMGYGLTEAGPRVSAQRYEAPQHSPAKGLSGGLSVGQTLPGIDWRIQKQMLYIHSPATMMGYLGAPNATQQVLKEGWLRTGDLAEYKGGALWILGREDDVFQSGGEKIVPLEIERVLCLLPEVQAAAVWPEPDLLLGQRIAAGLVSQSKLSRRVLRQHVGKYLPSTKHPRLWKQFTHLPLNSNGKLQRQQLAQWPGEAL